MSSISNDYDNLIEKLFAVHATDVFPENGVVQAGIKENPNDRGQGMYSAGVRSTLHFALNELVRPVGDDWMTWEDCRFAVITPLKKILPQTVNVNCYDTFILGSLVLDQMSTLVVSKEEAANFKEGHTFAIWTYDPEQMKLREAVEECIESLGGYPIRMESTDSEDRLGNAYLAGRNVNTQEFFAPLKDRHPQIGIGLRFYPLDGEGHLFSALERHVLLSVFDLLHFVLPEEPEDGLKESFVARMKLQNLEETRELIAGVLEKIDRYMGNHSFPEISLAAFAKNREAALKWVTILGIEIAARNNFSKTLYGSPLATRLQLFDVTSSTEIESFLASIEETLFPADPEWSS